MDDSDYTIFKRLDNNSVHSTALKKMAVLRFILLVTVLSLFLYSNTKTEAQRLSHGASDWYMRFRPKPVYIRRKYQVPGGYYRPSLRLHPIQMQRPLIRPSYPHRPFFSNAHKYARY